MIHKEVLTKTDLEIIRIALQAHINQCERYKIALQDREKEYIENKLTAMKRIIKEL